MERTGVDGYEDSLNRTIGYKGNPRWATAMRGIRGAGMLDMHSMQEI